MGIRIGYEQRRMASGQECGRRRKRAWRGDRLLRIVVLVGTLIAGGCGWRTTGVAPAGRPGVQVGAIATETPEERSPNRPAPTPTEEATPADDEGPYAGWARYENAAYGFAFRYPATWTLEEEAHLVLLRQGPLLLAISYKRAGEEVQPPWSGMPAGEVERRGTMAFMGQEIAKSALVYEGRVKVLTYSAKSGEVAFVLRLEDVESADYGAIALSEALEQEADRIVGSFERW